MQRRNFLYQSILGSGAALASAQPVLARAADKADNKAVRSFKCDYAPHFGMFENTAGKDLIDQLKYMHDQGFRSLEDNGMMARPVDEQEKIGKELNRLGMRMGVFVIDGGDNWKVSLTAGKQEFVDFFVATCRKAIEVGKRCNAILQAA